MNTSNVTSNNKPLQTETTQISSNEDVSTMKSITVNVANLTEVTVIDDVTVDTVTLDKASSTEVAQTEVNQITTAQPITTSYITSEIIKPKEVIKISESQENEEEFKIKDDEKKLVFDETDIIDEGEKTEEKVRVEESSKETDDLEDFSGSGEGSGIILLTDDEDLNSSMFNLPDFSGSRETVI